MAGELFEIQNYSRYIYSNDVVIIKILSMAFKVMLFYVKENIAHD